MKNAIIFCNRKREVATLHRSLVRHGFSAVASLAGPTYAQIDTLMGILHGEGDSAIGALLGQEGEHKGQHPWRSRATELMK